MISMSIFCLSNPSIGSEKAIDTTLLSSTVIVQVGAT